MKSALVALIALVGALSQSGCSAAGHGVAAGSSMPLAIPAPPVPGARMPAAPLPGRLALPDGGGRAPVVILLHGCGGIGNGRQLDDWTQRLLSWGYGALIIDSLTPRGVGTVCAPADQPKVTGFDRAGDVLDAALWLQGQPGVDGGRIGVIGFSHGGSTAVVVTRRHFQELHPGLLKAVVDYYGGCREPQTHGTVPLLAFGGEDDTWGDPARTCTDFAQHLRPDQPFQVFTYPNTVHAFDNLRLLGRRYSEGHPLEYNPAAADDSFKRTRAFLDQWMGGPG
jgi:dienelactone hydrolase